jgi:hypothetical protein
MKMFAGILLLLVSLALAVSLTSCHGCGKRGNGHVIIQNRNFSGFNKVSIEGVFPVEISQDGNAEFIKVEADENLQPLIVTEKDGSELVVKMKEGASVRKSKKMNVYINIKDLISLNNKSVGSLVSANRLKLDSIEVNSESVGKLELSLSAKFLRANLKSVGSTIFSGSVDEARINNKSVGKLSAFDLKAGNLMIHNTAIGITEVYADSTFYIRSSAIGTLYYKGPGVVKELSSEGIGRVKKID